MYLLYFPVSLSVIRMIRMNALLNIISPLIMPNTINLTGKEEATHELV